MANAGGEPLARQLPLTLPTGQDIVAQEEGGSHGRTRADDAADNPPYGPACAAAAGPRVLPAVAAFAVQCAICLKWRIIPTKQKYEEIRESILQKPFLCTDATVWRPCACCDEPADLSQDMSHLWAMDRPNIPSPPSGWERLLVIRGAGASKFADVYYVAPSGKKLRSLPEVERFLLEHPQYGDAGVSLKQFSFVIPRPLDETYVRKRASSSPEVRGSMAAKKLKLDGGPKAKQRQRQLASSAKQGLQRVVVGRTKSLAQVAAGSQSRVSFATEKEGGIPSSTPDASFLKQGLAQPSVNDNQEGDCRQSEGYSSAAQDKEGKNGHTDGGCSLAVNQNSFLDEGRSLKQLVQVADAQGGDPRQGERFSSAETQDMCMDLVLYSPNLVKTF